jgi:hypothetical protein
VAASAQHAAVNGGKLTYAAVMSVHTVTRNTAAMPKYSPCPTSGCWLEYASNIAGVSKHKTSDAPMLVGLRSSRPNDRERNVEYLLKSMMCIFSKYYSKKWLF